MPPRRDQAQDAALLKRSYNGLVKEDHVLIWLKGSFIDLVKKILWWSSQVISWLFD
ncbi:hypothetical protein HanPI659440_Chr04g0171761 [Helianthus annuus]|nr:hypothetical protein HanPI659440_Chr04g0171761 [Helianthus annuus]